MKILEQVVLTLDYNLPTEPVSDNEYEVVYWCEIDDQNYSITVTWQGDIDPKEYFQKYIDYVEAVGVQYLVLTYYRNQNNVEECHQQNHSQRGRLLNDRSITVSI